MTLVTGVYGDSITRRYGGCFRDGGPNDASIELLDIPQNDTLLASASEARSLLDLFEEAQDEEALAVITVLMYCLAERPIVQRHLRLFPQSEANALPALHGVSCLGEGVTELLD
jgi:hypothetical protein